MSHFQQDKPVPKTSRLECAFGMHKTTSSSKHVNAQRFPSNDATQKQIRALLTGRMSLPSGPRRIDHPQRSPKQLSTEVPPSSVSPAKLPRPASHIDNLQSSLESETPQKEGTNTKQGLVSDHQRTPDVSDQYRGLQMSPRPVNQTNQQATLFQHYLHLADYYRWNGYLDKAEYIYEYITEQLAISTDDEIMIQYQMAEIWLHQGRFKYAEDRLAKWEVSAQNVEARMKIGRLLGVAFDKRGLYFEALKALKSIKAATLESAKTFSTGKPSLNDEMLFVSDALATVLGHTGKYDAAIKLNGEVLEDAKEAVDNMSRKPESSTGEIHNDQSGLDRNSELTKLSSKLAEIKLHRAYILTDRGQYNEAHEWNKDALAYMEEILGGKHVATLDCWSLEAQLLALNGKVWEAQEQCQRTLMRMRRELGEEHPSTLRTLAILVSVYEARGLLAGAEYTAEYLVKKSKENHDLGPQHPQTIDSMAKHASVYSARGQLEKAESLQENVVEAAGKILGENHPLTLGYMSDLATIQCIRGDHSRAELLASDVLFRLLDVFFQKGHLTFQYPPPDMRNPVLYDHDSINEQIQTTLTYLDLSKQSDTGIHPTISSAIHCLGMSMSKRESGSPSSLELAKTLLSKATEYRKAKLGRLHPDTLSSRFELAILERQLGDLLNAKKGFEEVASGRKEVLGYDHPHSSSALSEFEQTRPLPSPSGGLGLWQNEIFKRPRENDWPSHPGLKRGRVYIVKGHRRIKGDGKEKAEGSRLKEEMRTVIWKDRSKDNWHIIPESPTCRQHGFGKEAVGGKWRETFT